MKTEARPSPVLKWLVATVPALFGGGALYACKRIWNDGFVKKRQRSWPIEQIYSASQDPLIYYFALGLALAWAVFCFWSTHRILTSERKTKRANGGQ